MWGRIADVAGWYGMLAILAAYGLASLDLASADGLVYQVLNLTGAAGLLLISLHKGVKQNAVLNLIWIAIALFAIARILI